MSNSMWPHSLQHTRLLCPPGVVLRFLSAESVVLSNHLTLFFFVVQSLSHVQLFATLWTAAHETSLSITNSLSLLKLISIESVMPSNHLILCHPFSSHLQSFPASGSFQMSQFFTSGGQSFGVSASASVQQWIFRTDYLWDWLIWSPCCPRDSQESTLIPQFKSINSLVLTFLYSPNVTSIHEH